MGRSKPLLTWRGETFLDRLISVLSAHCRPVIAVLGEEAAAVQTSIRRAGEAQLVLNSAFREGQLSSLQCGLRAVPEDSSGVAMTLVDLPAVRPETMAELAASFQGRRAPLVVPRYQGRRGHPVLFDRGIAAELLSLPAGSQAKTVIHRHLERAFFVDVEDPGIVEDIDTPEAYQRLLASGVEQ